MFLGHFAVAGITAVTPLDFVSYPYSHSLLFDLLWAALLVAASMAATSRPRPLTAAVWTPTATCGQPRSATGATIA
jgi:hypothetical protein